MLKLRGTATVAIACSVSVLRTRGIRWVMLVALAAAAVLPVAADGYVLGGAGWPTHTILYRDSGPNRAAVRAAVHA